MTDTDTDTDTTIVEATAIADSIERSVLIRAPREAVWAALVDRREFGTWFRADLDGDFAPGRRIGATCLYEGGHNGMRYWIEPVAMEPPALFAWVWPADGDRDAPTTRVTFRLAPEGEATRVTVTESGFAALPEGLAARKLAENSRGWDAQTENLRAHVEA